MALTPIVPAAVLAIADWAAVGGGRRRAEAVLKPAVMVALIAALVVASPVDDALRWWFVAALALCLAGDVFLLPVVDRFTLGLAAFLAGHLAFIAGFRTIPAHGQALLIALPVLAVFAALLAPPILRSVPTPLRLPVTVYLVVILAMAASAAVSLRPAAIAGAALFVVSDATLAWGRFVKPLPAERLVVITTYHAAQALLALSVLK